MNGLLRGVPLQLSYIGSFQQQADSSFHAALHRHPDHVEIMLIEQGTGTFVIDGRSYSVSPCSLIVYNQGVWHEEAGAPSIRIHFLGFANFVRPDLPEGMFIDPQSPCVIPLDARYDGLQRRFMELKAQWEKNPDDPFGIAGALFIVLLSEMMASLCPSPPSKPESNTGRTMIEIKKYLEEHYNESFSLDRLAHRFYLDKFHLSRTFKREFGVGPNQFVVQYRIEVAKNYLKMTSASLETITEKVGYHSVTHFANLFKSKTGVPPNQYRNM